VQNLFYKTNRKDRKFVYAQNENSKIESCLKFLEESFNFQVLIKKENQIQGKELLHPFGYEICSSNQ